MKKSIVLVMVLFLMLAGTSIFSGGQKDEEAVAPEGPLIFMSTQMTPAAEQAFAKGELLKGFTDGTGIEVAFINVEYFEMNTRLSAEVGAKKVTTSLVGELHGGLDVMNSAGLLKDLSGIKLPNRTFVKSLEDRSVIKGKKFYVPWLQATYIMAVDKKAFNYLPAGLTAEDVTNGTKKWTYDALLEWAKKLKEEFNVPKLGFPISPKGLWHRFLHGYIHPSFTGYQAKEFNSAGAVALWEYLRELMPYVHTASTTWMAMDEPLLKQEVLIAWDHTARLKAAIQEKPDQFLIVPVPSGPKGRGYITVAVGLGIPVDAPQEDNIIKLIDYLTKPEAQVLIYKNVGFFPVVAEAEGAIPEGPLKILAKGVLTQSATTDSIMVLIPSLGPKSGVFTGLYREVFTKVVIDGADIEPALKKADATMKSIFEEIGVPIRANSYAH